MTDSMNFAPDYDAPIEYMRRTRDYYLALGYDNPYRWAHYIDAPFQPLKKPLKDSTLALECGLVFRLPDDLRQLYLANGLDLARVLGNDSWFLPVPATYVVDSKGVIVFAYTNPDFRYRLEPSEVLNVLRLLKA